MTDRPYGSTIFCDDIRSEVGGKFSYIGAYMNSLIVHGDFPAVLPKLGFAISYLEPVAYGQNADDNLTLQIYMPGDEDEQPSFSRNVSLTNVRKAAQEKPRFLEDTPIEDRRIGLQIQFVASPANIQRPGIIRVRAKCGDDLIKLGALIVEQKLLGSEPNQAID